MELSQRRKQWSEQVASLKRMREWVWHTEQILSSGSGSGTVKAEEEQNHKLSNEVVGQLFDEWCSELAKQVESGTLAENEHKCLEHFLRISQHLRPYLIQCYSLEGLPRTNNEMEGYIRSLKTRYRRISGRKNWNSYLLRYGRSTAYYEWFEKHWPDWASQFEVLSKVKRQSWRTERQKERLQREEWLLRYRFGRNPSQYLHHLEERWKAAVGRT